MHRFQNIYRKSVLTEIIDELLDLTRIGEVHFIMHPPTEQRLRQYGLYEKLASMNRVRLRPRMPYTSFLQLLNCARAVISDGGSNQEELSYIGVPTVLFRDCSERPDGLGRNVILRKDIDGRLYDFAECGGLDELRCAPTMNSSVQPSKTVVKALKSWAE